MKIRIRRFDPTKLTQYATVMCIGKRGTGKTTLIRDIMQKMENRVDFGIAMCGTEETAADMGRFIPPSCIYNEFSAEALDGLLRHQKKCVAGGAFKKSYLVMDDTLYDKAVLKSKNMRMLFMNGRHRKIFFLCAVQYLMDIPPDLRSNVDFVFALKENIIANREKLWRNFFGMFNDYRDFSMVMNQCTAGYDCMVLDNTVRSNNLTDCVFWYRADKTLPDFRVGAPGVWALHDMFYRGEHCDGGGGGGGGSSSRRNKPGLAGGSGAAAAAQGGGDDDDEDDGPPPERKPRAHIHEVEKRDINGEVIEQQAEEEEEDEEAADDAAYR